MNIRGKYALFVRLELHENKKKKKKLELSWASQRQIHRASLHSLSVTHLTDQYAPTFSVCVCVCVTAEHRAELEDCNCT